MTAEPSGVSLRLLAKTTAAAAVVAAVAALAVAVCFVLVKAVAVGLTLLAAIVIGEAARPLVDRLAVRLPRAAAIGATFAAIAAAIALVWTIPLRALAPQALALWVAGPAYLSRAVAFIERFAGGQGAPAGGDWMQTLGRALLPFAKEIVAAQVTLGGVLSTFVVVLLSAAFWLGSSDALRAFLLSMVEPDRRAAAEALFDELGAKLGAYVSGVLLNGAIVALASWLLLSWLGAPYPAMLGLLQGLLVAVPYLGTLVSVLAVGVVVFAAQGWVKAAEAIAAIALMEGLEGSFISPLIFKQRVDVDPLTTILATAVGGALFGISGVVLAVPAAVVIQALVVEVAAPAVRGLWEPGAESS